MQTVQSPVAEAFLCESAEMYSSEKKPSLMIGNPQKVRTGCASKSLHAEQMIGLEISQLTFLFPPKDLNFFLVSSRSEFLSDSFVVFSLRYNTGQTWEPVVRAQLNHSLH